MNKLIIVIFLLTTLFSVTASAENWKDSIYKSESKKPLDSTLKVKIGEKAPDFSLNSISGKKVALNDYIGKKNIVLSFVPSAWTPVCSDQWPGYNIAKDIFEGFDAVLIGITVDNIPTLYSWTKSMGGVWFPVLSDFYPHGKVADSFGVLRSDGTTERALFIIDKKGIIRYIDVHDINLRPKLDSIVKELSKLNDEN